ncbi:MAG: dihydrodipicolinate synthase family protein [Planctomycetales bacterium]|nr:dihydrodipicolinate synthase family protein [Planctomycetales bacterium]
MTQPSNSPAPWLEGVIVPLVTPLVDDAALDDVAMARLVDHVIAGGVDALFVLGTTGEGPSLPHATRAEALGVVCDAAARRVPVLACISDTSLAGAVDLAMLAQDAGADAVVAAPPYYFPPTQAELALYFEQLAEEVGMPMLLYNMPGLTKVALEVDTLARLTEVENIVGVKDSSGDLDYFGRVVALRARRPDWSIFIGPEHLLPEAIAAGAQGGVHGGANIVPELFAELYRALVAGDQRRAADAQLRVAALQAIYDVGSDPGRFAKATKCAASILGLCDDAMAPPLAALPPEARRHIARVLAGLGLAEPAVAD